MKPVYLDSLQGPIRVRIERLVHIVTRPDDTTDKVVDVTVLDAAPGYPEGRVVRVWTGHLWDSVKRTGLCRHTFIGKTWKNEDIPTLKVMLAPRGDGFDLVPVETQNDSSANQ